MTKINSRQRRSNRFVSCGERAREDSLFSWLEFGRGEIAWRRRARRLARRIARGKIAVKECRVVPCPPFQNMYLEVFA